MNIVEKINILTLIEIATNKIKSENGENTEDQLMDAIRLLEIARSTLVKSYKELTNKKKVQNENN